MYKQRYAETCMFNDTKAQKAILTIGCNIYKKYIYRRKKPIYSLAHIYAHTYIRHIHHVFHTYTQTCTLIKKQKKNNNIHNCTEKLHAHTYSNTQTHTFRNTYWKKPITNTHTHKYTMTQNTYTYTLTPINKQLKFTLKKRYHKI